MKILKNTLFALFLVTIAIVVFVFINESDSRRPPRPGCWAIWELIANYRTCIEPPADSDSWTDDQQQDYRSWCQSTRQKLDTFGLTTSIEGELLSIRGTASIYSRDQLHEFCAMIPDTVYEKLPPDLKKKKES